MPNILPKTEVRGSLLVDILQAEGKGYICQQLQMIEIACSLSLILLWFI